MSNQLALVKKDTVDVVAQKIREFQQRGEIHFPADYSPENAMKAAWLTLQSTVDRNGKPALQVCTRDSIANALLDMVVQGLNPSKKQCYFVVYGNKLVCMRSYFGSMAVVKRVLPESEIYYGVVYEGDEFEYSIERGRKRILKHVQKIENVRPDKIVAAYCVIEPGGNRPPYTEIMTIDQIKQAWKQGQTYKENGEGVHQKFSDQMAVKTVINRACKYVINSSSDNYLLLHHFNRTDEMTAEQEVADEIAANANKEVIDIETEVINGEEGAEPEQAANTEQQELSFDEESEATTAAAGPGF